MIHIDSPFDCCGCTACASICNHNAIDMVPDTMGFLYPSVNQDKCVQCGLCDTVCQFNDNYDKSLNLDYPLAFAARHKDMNEIMKSRSGAVFEALSSLILEQGGVVYGAGYRDHFRIVHKRATTKEERDEFRGSKYVQSDMTDVFRQVKTDLREGLTVLFSGTPCQTSGLHSFVGKNLRKNLVLIDIVCHGVASPYAWRDYLAYLEKKYKSRITYVNFRDKELYGWKDQKETFRFENGGGKKSFLFLFYQNIYFRYSCSKCHFTNFKRPSDITLADYWGWERINSTFNADDKGCSLVLCNTTKGIQLFDQVKNELNTIQVELEQATQTHLREPSIINPNRKSFEDFYSIYGLELSLRHFGLIGWRYWYYRVRNKIIRTIRLYKGRRL